MWIFQISVFYGRDFWWENLKGYHRKDLLTVPRAKIKLSKLRSKCSGFNKLVLNIPWPFFEHLRSSIFLPDLNFLFSLALLNRAGMVQTFKKYVGFIKGTASEQKLFEIFFKIFNIFQPGGGWPNVSGRAFMWIFVLYSPSALLWFSSTMQPHILEYVVLNTNVDSWKYMNLDFLKVSLSVPTNGWTRWFNQSAWVSYVHLRYSFVSRSRTSKVWSRVVL